MENVSTESTGNEWTDLRKIVIHEADGFVAYDLFFSRKEKERISLIEATQRLPLPVLLYLGVRDGKLCQAIWQHH